MNKNVLTLALACALALFFGVSASAQTVLVDIPLDQQINLGLPGTNQSPDGDAIYPLAPPATTTFESDGVDSWTRLTINPGGWWYAYLDMQLAGLGGVDITTPGKIYKMEWDCRFYQDPIYNSSPYSDAPVFLRIYSYGPDGNTLNGWRDFGIVYGTQSPWNNPPYPEWTRVSVIINNSELQTYTEDNPDTTNINRLRWYGTDWSWLDVGDFVDFKNFQIIEETAPATISGIVTDANGKPIEGAVVGIKPVPPAASPQAPATASTAVADAMRYKATEKDGSYSLLLDAGEYFIAAWTPGYQPTPDTYVEMEGIDLTGVNMQITTVAADNIAVGATVTVTNEDTSQFPATGGVDGNFGTRWATDNPLPDTEQNQTYTIDLGSVNDITGLTIVWENAYPGAYAVSLTNDDPNGSPAWTTVYDAPEANGGWNAPGTYPHYEPIGFAAGTTARGIQISMSKFGPYPIYSAWEFIVHGNTWTQLPAHVMTIPAAKQLPDNAPVELIRPVSHSGMWSGGESSVYRDTFWMEEYDRSSGIRIDMVDHYCFAREVDYVKGIMATDPTTGERYILGESVNWLFGPDTDTAPVAMSNRNLLDSNKLPVGLLVRSWGTVTDVLEDGYMMSDGSADPVKVVLDGVLPSVGTFVTVTGALGGEPTIYTTSGDGWLRTWLFNGTYCSEDPYPDLGYDDPVKWPVWQQLNLDTDFLAEAGGESAIQPSPGDIGPNGAEWFVWTASDWAFGNLDSLPWERSEGSYDTIYGSLWVYADREWKGEDVFQGDPNDGLVIQVGSDDGYKFFLNGEAVYELNLWRGLPGQGSLDQINYNNFTLEPLVLNHGWNHLLIKVNNIAGGWAMAARLVVDDPNNPGQKIPLNLPISLGTP